MNTATFRLYGPLNDFLPARLRQRLLERPVTGRSTVKDSLESLGVPHPEIALILVNGNPVDFHYLVQAGDRVSAFPQFWQWEISSLSKVSPPPLEEPRFVVDVNLGRLARHMRLLGFDTLYLPQAEDEELARKSCEEKRWLLTRDPELLKRSCVQYGYWVRQRYPGDQAVEVIQKFSLESAARPGSRCLVCNSLLVSFARESLPPECWSQVPPRVRNHYKEFRLCPGCSKVYWAGTHWDRMERFASLVLERTRKESQGKAGKP
ncbi:Mut7-C RNAse domain-containing protein [Candidatus Methylacidithermus pantelleriae]|uniref:Twitching motility protein PilT n=1 Tax=Candidatus Methylacidithermus pantelleriae TaxID=2744239 RepID=A0A8J2BRS3_9BACT|nr:Mut7-C RNAse domain-containing protein [Candidatus Methylacidithermus pantelleriae]CAF0692969.1 conserved hypothetical protein [Candidatus Methylacidithermus pantelleriae]